MPDRLTGLKLITAPAVEPLSLSEAKAYLRVDHPDDDALISAIISAARTSIEERTRRALITQTWALSVPCIPADGQPLPRAPFQSISEVRFFVGGDQVAIDTGRVNLYQEPARIFIDQYPGNLDDRRDAIEVQYIAGYGDAAADVPTPIIHALKLLISHLYEHRSTDAPIPEAVGYLLEPYQLFAIGAL